MAPKRRKSRKSSSRSSRKKASSRKRHSPKGRSRFGNVIDVDGSNNTVERMTMKTFVDIVRQMAIQSIEYIGQENAEQMYNNVVEWTSELEKLYLELEDIIAKEASMNLFETGEEEEMNLLDVEIASKEVEIEETQNKIKTAVFSLDGLLNQETSAQNLFQQWVTEKNNSILPPELRSTNAPGLKEGIDVGNRKRPIRRPEKYNHKNILLSR